MVVNPHSLILGLAILGGFVVSCCTARVCDADRTTNGCSTPMGMNAPFKHEFTPACDKHDICYGCGHHYNWSRANCDKSLLNDMIGACHSLRRRKRSVADSLLDIWYFFQGLNKAERRCELAAEMYYKIVRTFGGSHFEKRDHAYCTSTCADKHGSPIKSLY
ncbi:uncharacterized protein [Montipora foliosa]|uniref:uncharacterized protein n=1 Tax=Montipora foliosa TaxID=591990 RepID=UPI0035F20EB9